MSNIKQLSRYELEKTDVQKSQISESVFPNHSSSKLPSHNFSNGYDSYHMKDDEIVSQTLPIIGHSTAATLEMTGHSRKPLHRPLPYK